MHEVNAVTASAASEISSLRLWSHSRATSSRRGTKVRSASSTQQHFELHVCTNKTCKKQGCKEVLKFAKDLAIEQLQVEEVGCLGGCGSGPNMVLMPGAVPLRHISTPAKVTDVLRRLCALEVPETLLKATEKRLAGNAEARSGDLQRAVQLFTEGIEQNPPSGVHMLYSNRAGARLALGDKSGAVDDANTAAALSPQGFHTAYIRQVEAYAALGKYREADATLQAAGRKSASFRETKEYKSLSSQLKAALQGSRR